MFLDYDLQPLKGKTKKYRVRQKVGLKAPRYMTRGTRCATTTAAKDASFWDPTAKYEGETDENGLHKPLAKEIKMIKNKRRLESINNDTSNFQADENNRYGSETSAPKAKRGETSIVTISTDHSASSTRRTMRQSISARVAAQKKPKRKANEIFEDSDNNSTVTKKQKTSGRTRMRLRTVDHIDESRYV